MSYTNQTANYGLPQYTADDKPTYLGDFNKAMLDIDTAIKANENIATASQTLAQNANNSASEALSTANTASSSATNAGVRADNAYALAESAKADATKATTDATDAKTIANSANQTATSANTTATNAQTAATNANNTATSAQTTANSANTKAEHALNLIEKFNLTDITTFKPGNITTSNCSLGGDTRVTVVLNTDGSIGKIYGNGYITPSSAGPVSLQMQTNIRPTSDMTIRPLGTLVQSGNLRIVEATITTSGLLTLAVYGYDTTTQVFALPACLYFFQNFGDEPENN